MLNEQSSESVFFNCLVRLIKVGCLGTGSLTYASLAREEHHAKVRKEIYACVSCGFTVFIRLMHFVITLFTTVVLKCCTRVLLALAAQSDAQLVMTYRQFM